LPGGTDIPSNTATADQAEARLRLFAAFGDIIRQAAQDRGLMIVIEDGQWADPTTVELLGYLAEQIVQARVLLILSYRPEEVGPGGPLQTLQRSQIAHLIDLDLLTPEQVGSFLEAVLGRESAPDWLVDSFYQATEGNPLFIEETLKTLAAEGQVAEWVRDESSQRTALSTVTLQLPKNVLALAERRLQMLSEDDRPILTAAAVLGPEFPFALLQGITKLDEDTLLDAIDRLLAARLIEELLLQDGEDRYRFVGSDEQLTVLFTHRGRELELGGLYDDALSNYQELETLARKRSKTTLELVALIPHATLHSTYTAKFDPEQGRELSERALALAQELTDYQAEAKVLWNLMLVAFYGEKNPHQAKVYGEQALSIARQHNLREEMAYILSDFGGIYATLGNREQAGAALTEAGELWQELNNLPMLAGNLLSTAEGYYIGGRTDEALELAQEALRISRSTGSIWGQARSMGTIGPIYMQRGEMGAAIKIMEEALPLVEQADFAVPLNVHIVLAWAYSFLGDFERGFELANFALARAEKSGRVRSYALAMLAKLHVFSGTPARAEMVLQEAMVEMDADQSTSKLLYNWFLYMVGSEVALANQKYDDALTLIDRTIESTRTIGIRPFLTYLLYLKSQTLLGLGQVQDAREVLLEGRAEADAQKSTNLQQFQVLYGLSEVEDQLGDAATAQLLRQEAREVIDFVAAGIDDPSLLASFLALPNVKAVLENT